GLLEGPPSGCAYTVSLRCKHVLCQDAPVPQRPLTREAILRQALELADRDGLRALSMRRLGRELGVEAMSLYRHVGSKQALLEGLVELVLGEARVDPGAGAP